MRQIISYEMRRFAEYLLFAAGLNIEELHHITEVLKDIVKDDSNFEPTLDAPLTLNKKGQKELRGVNQALQAADLLTVIKRLDKAIKDGATENEDLTNLNTALQKTLRRTGGKWINAVLRGKSLKESLQTFTQSVLNPFELVVDNLTLTPKTRGWEKEEIKSQAPKGMSPEDYKEYLKKEEQPGQGPGPEFDPWKRPQSIKPERVLDRKS